MKARDVIESIFNNMGTTDKQEALDVMKDILRENDYYVCRDEVELMNEALANTDLVENNNQ